MMMRSLFHFSLALLILASGLVVVTSASAATQTNSETAKPGQHSSAVMEQFNVEKALAAERAISTKSKHQILFWMGTALLCLIFLAAGFGIAMGIFDKDVFVWHVLSAGLATTLAITHAVVAFVWFYPN